MFKIIIPLHTTASGSVSIWGFYYSQTILTSFPRSLSDIMYSSANQTIQTVHSNVVLQSSLALLAEIRSTWYHCKVNVKKTPNNPIGVQSWGNINFSQECPINVEIVAAKKQNSHYTNQSTIGEKGKTLTERWMYTAGSAYYSLGVSGAFALVRLSLPVFQSPYQILQKFYRNRRRS